MRYYAPSFVFEFGQGFAVVYWGGDEGLRNSGVYNAGEWPLRPDTHFAGGYLAEGQRWEAYGPSLELDSAVVLGAHRVRRPASCAGLLGAAVSQRGGWCIGTASARNRSVGCAGWSVDSAPEAEGVLQRMAAPPRALTGVSSALTSSRSCGVVANGVKDACELARCTTRMPKTRKKHQPGVAPSTLVGIASHGCLRWTRTKSSSSNLA